MKIKLKDFCNKINCHIGDRYDPHIYCKSCMAYQFAEHIKEVTENEISSKS